MADTAGQCHALIDLYGDTAGQLARSHWLLWPIPQASGALELTVMANTAGQVARSTLLTELELVRFVADLILQNVLDDVFKSYDTNDSKHRVLVTGVRQSRNGYQWPRQRRRRPRQIQHPYHITPPKERVAVRCHVSHVRGTR